MKVSSLTKSTSSGQRSTSRLYDSSKTTAFQSAQVIKKTLSANQQYGQFVESGVQSDVVVIPQWHLAPQTNTRSNPLDPPQSENQLAIYHQLVDWIQNNQLKTVIAEGCEGEIKPNYTERFNGWTLGDLRKLSQEALDSTMTHVALKLEARFGDSVSIVCGDDLKLIKKHQLILSDLRGLLGFKLRIDQLRSEPPKRAEYLDSLRSVLKLRPTMSEASTLAALDSELQKKIADFERVLHERDQAFIRALETAPKPAAVVIGAIHVDDLERGLKDQNTSFLTFRPNGLKGDEAELIDQVKKLLLRP